MIVNIRGTGGSGKSTIARAVMDRYRYRTAAYIEGRKQPIGYLCDEMPGPAERNITNRLRPALWVPGHYETACGGCDTIKTPDAVYASVIEHADRGHDVLFEGIIVQDDVTRAADLARRHQLLVIALEVPIEQCLEAIRARRAEKGDSRPLNPTNTVNRAARLRKIIARLRDSGVEVQRLGREDALAATLQAFGWEA